MKLTLMRRVLFSVLTVAIIFLTVVYASSCRNAGRMLALDQFMEGFAGRASNCGGSSAASADCYMIWAAAVLSASNNGATADFNQLVRDHDNRLVQAAAADHWIPDAVFLLRQGTWRFGTNTHELVVVCKTAYGNVPQPNIWNLHRRTFLHAAAYSDGTTGWLTPAEFTGLDLSKFFEYEPPPVEAKPQSQ